MVCNTSPSRRTIYVLLTDTGTRFTSMIKWFTGAPYNHASLALDEGLNEMYSFGRKCATNPWSAGFVREDIYEGTYSYFPNTRCKLLKLEVTSEQHDALHAALREYHEQREAYTYNLLGLLGVLLSVHIPRKRAHFCSEFVAEALRRSGLSLWDRPSALVTPDDFRVHPAFDEVYEGELYDYPMLGLNKDGNSHAAA